MSDAIGFIGFGLLIAAIYAAVRTRKLRLGGFADWKQWRVRATVGFVLAFGFMSYAGRQDEIKRSPEHYSAGIAFFEAGNVQQAIDEFKLVSECDSQHYSLAQAKIAEANKVIATQLIAEAKSLAERGDYKTALARAKEAKSVCPSYCESENLAAKYQSVLDSRNAKSGRNTDAEAKKSASSPDEANHGPKKDFFGNVEIKPTMRYEFGQISIQNSDDFDYKRVKITINPTGFTGGFHAHLEQLTPGEECTIDLSDFARNDGLRFDLSQMKILKMQITCKTPYGNAIASFGGVDE